MREFVELAALVAIHGRGFIRAGRISESALEAYWSASKARCDLWLKRLGEYTGRQAAHHGTTTADHAMAVAWQAVRPTFKEILVAEVLTRVWTAVACAHDQRRRGRTVEPVVRSVYGCHQEARHRALNLLVYGRGFNTQEAVELNRLRRRCERWTDVLLAYVIREGAGEEWSFEPERSREFAAEISEQSHAATRQVGWQLVSASLSAAFEREGTFVNETAPYNQHITKAILACYPSDLCDAVGPFESLWLERLDYVATDTLDMIDNLVQSETPRLPASASSVALKTSGGPL